MCERCDYIISRFDIVGVDSFTVPEDEDVFRECLRPAGHDGPHLILTLSGKLILWQEDLCDYGTCDDCDSEDPVDNCLVFWEITEMLAKCLANTTDYEEG